MWDNESFVPLPGSSWPRSAFPLEPSSLAQGPSRLEPVNGAEPVDNRVRPHRAPGGSPRSGSQAAPISSQNLTHSAQNSRKGLLVEARGNPQSQIQVPGPRSLRRQLKWLLALLILSAEPGKDDSLLSACVDSNSSHNHCYCL